MCEGVCALVITWNKKVKVGKALLNEPIKLWKQILKLCINRTKMGKNLKTKQPRCCPANVK